MRVGVIFGGRSVEHDVSVVTAHQLMAVLSESHDVVPIYVTREGRWLTAPGLNDLEVYRTKRWEEVGEEGFIPPSAGYGGLLVPGSGPFKRARKIPLDVAIPAIHGTYGEDGTLPGLLELADIPYPGPGVLGSSVGMDKIVMKAAFAAVGLPVVDHVTFQGRQVEADVEAVAGEVEGRFGYPVFVKPVRLGSSVGIGKAKDRAQLIEALQVASNYDRRLLVEPSMEGCIEINCAVLGGGDEEPQVSVCEQPVAVEEFLSFQDKYLRGGKSEQRGAKDAGMATQDRHIPAPISDELTKQVQENAIKAFKAIDCSGVARVDAFVNESSGETWVNEINTIPGSFSFYLWEASGLSFKDLMERLIAIARSSFHTKSQLLFTFETELLDRGEGGKSRG